MIDADALVDAVKNRIEEDRGIYPNFSRFSRVGMRIVISIIKKQDTVDPLKHGHWIHVDELHSGDCFKCSECNSQLLLDFGWKASFESPADKFRYCPNCGAKMDKKEDENHDD